MPKIDSFPTSDNKKTDLALSQEPWRVRNRLNKLLHRVSLDVEEACFWTEWLNQNAKNCR